MKPRFSDDTTVNKRRERINKRGERKDAKAISIPDRKTFASLRSPRLLMRSLRLGCIKSGPYSVLHSYLDTGMLFCASD